MEIAFRLDAGENRLITGYFSCCKHFFVLLRYLSDEDGFRMDVSRKSHNHWLGIINTQYNGTQQIKRRSKNS